MKKNKLSLSQAIKSEFNYDIEEIMKKNENINKN